MRKEKYNSDDDFIEEVDDSDMSDGTYQEEESDDNNSTGGEEDIEHHAVAVTPSPRRPSRRCVVQTNKRMSNTIQELSDDDNNDDDEDDDDIVGTEEGQHKRKRTTTRRKIILDSSDEDSDGPGDDENETHHGGTNTQTSTNLSSSNTNSRTRQIQCDSIVDAKTAKPLQPRSPHVCYTDQNGDRHCYALNTMYRMAIENHVEGQKLTFLQPPYFDTPMSEDLEDQIACRFGRGALDIEKSKNYRKYYERFTLGLGRHDLYCCPICYNEADMMQGRGGMASDDDSSTDEEHEAEDYFTFDDDPMTILAKVGCKVASSFCFLKVVAVRQHLTDVHKVDFEGLKGNDLLQRFKIRSADGLLQHFTSDMWGYWQYNGNAQTFRNLVQLVQDKEERKPEANPEFCTSFPNRGQKIWRSLRAPFLRHDSDSEEDEIINDDDDDSDMEENQVEVPIFVPPDQSEIEEDNQYVEGLKQRAEQYEEEEDDETGSSQSVNDSDFINNDSSSAAAESEDGDDEEQEDSWMAAKENQFQQQRKMGRSKTKSDEESDDDNMFQSDFVQGKKKCAKFTANDEDEDNE